MKKPLTIRVDSELAAAGARAAWDHRVPTDFVEILLRERIEAVSANLSLRPPSRPARETPSRGA